MSSNLPLQVLKYGVVIVAAEYFSRKIYTYFYSENPKSYSPDITPHSQKIVVEADFTRIIKTQHVPVKIAFNKYSYDYTYNASTNSYNYGWVYSPTRTKCDDFEEVIISDSKVPKDLGVPHINTRENFDHLFLHKKSYATQTYIIAIKQKLYLTGQLENGIFMYHKIKTRKDLSNPPDGVLRQVMTLPLYAYLLYDKFFK